MTQRRAVRLRATIAYDSCSRGGPSGAAECCAVRLEEAKLEAWLCGAGNSQDSLSRRRREIGLQQALIP